jgi:hypothetical protein
MNPRTIGVSIAAAAMLTAATVCLAQEATPPPAAPAATPVPPAEKAGGGAGRGSLGGQFGGSTFYTAEDYSRGAQPRLAFAASFRYQMNGWLRWQVSPGFTWAAYDHEEPMPFTDPSFPADLTRDDLLTLVLPMSVQVQLTTQRGAWKYHVGAGPGLYRVWVENRRKVLKDPVTFELHRALHPGLTAQAGVERFLRALPNISVEGTVASHQVFATDDERYPSGFNSSLGAVEVRLGANYHFSLDRPKKAPENPAITPPPAR